jgi:hypothetical protein
MNEQETHQMSLETTHESGAEEWHCSMCGRRLLLQFSPVFRKVVLAPGDEIARHSGGKGELPHHPSPPLTLMGVEASLATYPPTSPDDRADDDVVQSEEDVPEPLRPWFIMIRLLEHDGL